MFRFGNYFILIDSKEDNCPLAPGESYEKYVSLDRGKHDMSTTAARVNDRSMGREEVGLFLIDVYLRDGKCIASSRTNYMPDMICIIIPTNLSLKIKVTRTLECKYKEKMHFSLHDSYDPV
jgi:hypothetical protein